MKEMDRGRVEDINHLRKGDRVNVEYYAGEYYEEAIVYSIKSDTLTIDVDGNRDYLEIAQDELDSNDVIIYKPPKIDNDRISELEHEMLFVKSELAKITDILQL